MTRNPDCIFCKIVAGEIPSIKVYEDDRFVCFMDINPVTRGHCLLIPKDHHETIFTIPEELLRDLIAVTRKLAGRVVKGVEAEGINLIQSNGRAANQIIDHYHMHLIPRYDPTELKGMAWEMNPGDMTDIAAAGESIKGAE